MWSSIHVCVVWYECMYVRVYVMCVYVVRCVYEECMCYVCDVVHVCV